MVVLFHSVVWPFCSLNFKLQNQAFFIQNAFCLWPQHRLLGTTYHISGTWCSHPFKRSVLNSTSSYRIHMVFAVLVCACILVVVPVLFKCAINCRTGGPVGLWLSDGILWVRADRELTDSCRRYVESGNLSVGMIYTFHISKQEWNYNAVWNKLSVTSLKVVFLTKRNSPCLTGWNSPRCRLS
jgi:hypothetical protein